MQSPSLRYVALRDESKNTISGGASLKLLGMKRLVDFTDNMATFAVGFSLFVIAVLSLLGLIFAATSLYSAYLHWKYSHLPGPKRDSFFSGHIPHILRERERGKIIDEAKWHNSESLKPSVK